MEPKWAIIAFGVIPLAIMLLTSWYIQASQKKHYDKLIDGYTDTIQRLINREPVTYQETNQKPPKIIEEVYSAWGNITVDREVQEE